MRGSSPGLFVKRGFTLIELLAAISIIAALAAILFPVLAQAREKVRQVSCMSNLKQIGFAWLQYAQDYDETNVCKDYLVGTTRTGTRYFWFTAVEYGKGYDPTRGLIYPYTKNIAIQACLSAANIPVKNFLIAYGLNNNVHPFEPQTRSYQTTSLAQINVPTETVIMADAAGYSATSRELWRTSVIYPPSNRIPGVHARHNGSANILWFDGHVKAMALGYRTDADALGVSAADRRSHNIGDVTRPGCPHHSTCQDYYYVMAKPPLEM
jgi:prepilin-type N-terminal cleavage/methylation domain-containing protein/prepilin-type processing-associated H-X9-DG protein